MSTQRIRRLWWIDTRDMLADGLNKGAVSRKALFTALMKGVWHVAHETVSNISRGIILSEHDATDWVLYLLLVFWLRRKR